VHVKRTADDCVLQLSLLKLIIGYNALMALLVVMALVLDAVLYGSWGVLAAFICLMAVPFATAAISSCGYRGDRCRFEAWRLMVQAFPVYLLATPTFVAFLSAYNLARLADLSWGNRPTVSFESSLASLDRGVEAQTLHAQWMQRQTRSCQLFNAFFVIFNLMLQALGQTLASGVAWLPRRSDGDAPAYEGALELCLLFSVPYVTQQLVALVLHVSQSVYQNRDGLQVARIKSRKLQDLDAALDLAAASGVPKCAAEEESGQGASSNGPRKRASCSAGSKAKDSATPDGLAPSADDHMVELSVECSTPNKPPPAVSGRVCSSLRKVVSGIQRGASGEDTEEREQLAPQEAA